MLSVKQKTNVEWKKWQQFFLLKIAIPRFDFKVRDAT